MATDPLAPIKDAFDAVRGQSKTLLAAAAIVLGFAASPDRLGKYDAALAELQTVRGIQKPVTRADYAARAAIDTLERVSRRGCQRTASAVYGRLVDRIEEDLGPRSRIIDSASHAFYLGFRISGDASFTDDTIRVSEYRGVLNGPAWTRCPRLHRVTVNWPLLRRWAASGSADFALVYHRDTISLREVPGMARIPLFRVSVFERQRHSIAGTLMRTPDGAGGSIGARIMSFSDSVEATEGERIPMPDGDTLVVEAESQSGAQSVYEYRNVVAFPAVRRLAVLGVRVDTLTIPDAIELITERRDAESETIDLFGLRISERLALLVGPIALFLVALIFWFHMRHLVAAARKVDPSGRLPDDIRELAWLPMLGSRRLRILNAAIWTLLPLAAVAALVARDGVLFSPQRVVAMLLGLGAAALLAASMRILWRLAPPAH